jgi:hypothetical protein
MSLNFTQIQALIDRNCKSSSVSYTVADKTADINLALDKALSIIFTSSGKWQFDDSNQTDYPFITTDLTANKRDYTFTTDGSGNLILDIYKVMVKDPTSGYFFEILPVDQQSDEYTQGFWSGQNSTGTPYRYDKTANGIFLDALPGYTSSGGLKVFINREGSYFTTSDTTKKPGFAGLFHEYLALRPSYMYAYRNSLPNANLLQNEMLLMEAAMKNYYSDRGKDENPKITPETVLSI